MSDVKPSPQFKLPPADLKKYLISLGWLDEESLPTKGEDRAKAMAPLLDLDLSVSIAQMLESPPVAQLVATDFALVGAQTDLLFETIQTAMEIMISQFVIGNAVGIGCFTENDWVEP